MVRNVPLDPKSALIQNGSMKMGMYQILFFAFNCRSKKLFGQRVIFCSDEVRYMVHQVFSIDLEKLVFQNKIIVVDHA